MTPDEKIILKRVQEFENELQRSTSFNHLFKKMQDKVDGLIPEKVHQNLASALEKGIKAFLQGLYLLESSKPLSTLYPSQQLSLQELRERGEQIVKRYKQIALVEGAGTGFGGLLSSAIDFPALLTIKFKLLQELALLYGHRLANFQERIYLLKIFQLEFSSQEIRRSLWTEIKSWEKDSLNRKWYAWEDIDWPSFYLEYKQSIELKKLLQIIPGFGALVGAWANHSFLDSLGKTALLALEWRALREGW